MDKPYCEMTTNELVRALTIEDTFAEGRVIVRRRPGQPTLAIIAPEKTRTAAVNLTRETAATIAEALKRAAQDDTLETLFYTLSSQWEAEGLAAKQCGASRRTNPYIKGSAARQSWRWGWLEIPSCE